MKTAISIPEDVYQSAEKLAEQLGTSRSRLYTRALKAYLSRQRSDEITKKYDEIYKDIDSSLDPALREMRNRSLSKDDW